MAAGLTRCRGEETVSDLTGMSLMLRGQWTWQGSQKEFPPGRREPVRVAVTPGVLMALQMGTHKALGYQMSNKKTQDMLTEG